MNPRTLFDHLVRNYALSRREALREVVKLAGLAAAAPLLEACGDSSPVLTAADLTPEDVPIDHVVFVMMENRTFDHYFGSLSLAEGRGDVDGLQGDESNALPDGTPVAPFRLTDLCVADPPHGWTSSRNQFADGANSGFVTEHFDDVQDPTIASQVMGYHDRGLLPFYYGLADEFTLCQRWFASVMGPTWPNRYYFHAAQSAGLRSNGLLPHAVPTIYDLLDAAGITWRYYFTDLPFVALLALNDGDGSGLRIDFKKFQQYGRNIAPVSRFAEDAAAGNLPQVAIVDPSFALADDHPPHHVQLGQGFVSSIFHSLASSPQWEKSLMLLTYDEHGGFFDHVPPPKAADERAADGFDQLGFRVPSMALGPWVKRGYASNEVLDHTSPLAFLEWRWGLPALTQRDAAANRLLDVLDVARIATRKPRSAPTLPEVGVDKSQFRAYCVTGNLTDLEIAANRGWIPPQWDLRSGVERTLETMIRGLARHGAGGIR